MILSYLIPRTGVFKLADNWKLIKKEMDLVEKKLNLIIEDAGPEIKMIGSYILKGAGKRIRPALFLTAAQRPGVKITHMVDIAAAFELLHTASLLHDDVIDQAATRRGRETVHLRWTNKIAVLSGDYLLSQVYRILVSCKNWPLMDLVVKMVQNLAEGEVEQAFAEYRSPDLEQKYFTWIGKKSASFFAGCCEAGSLMAGDSAKDQESWAAFGYHLGIAFQLIDDLLDYRGKEFDTGKPLYGDLHNRVLTLPLIRTMQSNNQLSPELLSAYLGQYGENGEACEQVVQVVLKGDGLDYTFSKAEEYATKAIDSIEGLTGIEPEKKEALVLLPRSLLLRTK